MARSFTSDGIETQYKKNGVSQKLSGNEYTAATPLRNTKRSVEGVVESGTTYNCEYERSQEVYDAHGLTTGYTIKMVGTEEMFTGTAQQSADQALAETASLLLQDGDTRNTTAPSDLIPIDFQKLTSSMTSGWAASMSPSVPQISRLSDLPKLTAYIGAYIGSLSAENAAYQAMMAGKAELERQYEQAKLTLKRLTEQFSEEDLTPEMLAGTPAKEEKPAHYNLTRQQVYETYIPNLPTILNNESQIS